MTIFEPAIRRCRSSESAVGTMRSLSPFAMSVGWVIADLSVITHPTLIANGDNDRMVPTALSEDLHRRIAGSKIVIYPNSGHGAIFQNNHEFTSAAIEFIDN